ncbi:MAG TPA: hypothetical protein VNI01_14655 [Elusimicrobiota bacterium]|nr:hypothetical protein [Elusimicrobiota bacterium]
MTLSSPSFGRRLSAVFIVLLGTAALFSSCSSGSSGDGEEFPPRGNPINESPSCTATGGTCSTSDQCCGASQGCSSTTHTCATGSCLNSRNGCVTAAQCCSGNCSMSADHPGFLLCQ